VRFQAQRSGGQQRWVARTHALVMEPQVLPLDEPLSTLDAKLREAIRFKTKELGYLRQVTII
jgi:ABC-type Fe3+/spermidine/putrescine transport system ATPase subunit